jgi:hypothetical protein
MDYETAIQLAHQRMREIGKSRQDYHIEPVCIIGTALERIKGEIRLKAYNEYYYLVNYEKYTGFMILSDSGFFNADDYTENTYQEFTGLIRILQKKSVGVPPPNNIAPRTMVAAMMPQGELIPTQTAKAIDFIKVTIH